MSCWANLGPISPSWNQSKSILSQACMCLWERLLAPEINFRVILVISLYILYDPWDLRLGEIHLIIAKALHELYEIGDGSIKSRIQFLLGVPVSFIGHIKKKPITGHYFSIIFHLQGYLIFFISYILHLNL